MQELEHAYIVGKLSQELEHVYIVEDLSKELEYVYIVGDLSKELDDTGLHRRKSWSLSIKEVIVDLEQNSLSSLLPPLTLSTLTASRPGILLCCQRSWRSSNLDTSTISSACSNLGRSCNNISIQQLWTLVRYLQHGKLYLWMLEYEHRMASNQTLFLYCQHNKFYRPLDA